MLKFKHESDKVRSSMLSETLLRLLSLLASSLFDYVITSTIRTVSENDAIGGKKNSQHLKGLAIDIAKKVAEEAGKEQELKEWCDQLGLKIIDEKNHYHIQQRGNVSENFVSFDGNIGEKSEEAW